MKKTTHYQPSQSRDGSWEFTTPTGLVVDSMSHREALHLAELTRRQDMATAATGCGLGALLLLDYFATQEVAS